MLKTLKRMSLSSEAVNAIRTAITEHCWTEFIPGERKLCDALHVSRPTIRRALETLAAEGLIEVRRGRPCRIVTPADGFDKKSNPLVGIISPDPLWMRSMATNRYIGEMRLRLADRGFGSEVFLYKGRHGVTQCRQIEAYLLRAKPSACLLLSANQHVQKWFTDRQLPALVSGSCHRTARLPSIDKDNRAVCRHGAGVFLSRGHRRLALIVPNSGMAGTLESEKGFLEALSGLKETDCGGVIIRDNGSALNLNTKLDALFASPRPPTAILVARWNRAIQVMLYLFRRGIAIPGDVSLICRDSDNFFNELTPQISHYSINEESFGARLTRLMLRLVSEGRLPPIPTLVFPRYFPGATVGEAPPLPFRKGRLGSPDERPVCHAGADDVRGRSVPEQNFEVTRADH